MQKPGLSSAFGRSSHAGRQAEAHMAVDSPKTGALKGMERGGGIALDHLHPFGLGGVNGGMGAKRRREGNGEI